MLTINTGDGQSKPNSEIPFLANLISAPVLSDPKVKVHILASITQFREGFECRLSLKLHSKQFAGCGFLK